MPFDDDERRQPGGRGTGERAINLPPAVLWLIGINVAIQLVRQLLPEQADLDILVQFGLVPLAYTSGNGDLLSLIAAPITYQFIHGGWMHLGINMLTLAAFGAPVERLLGVKRFVAFYLVCGIVAGAVHILVYPDSPDPVVGASGSISGVFGAVLMLMRYVGSLTSLLPVAAIWIGLNVFFGLFGGAPGAGGESIAWVAHIAGFVFGLAAIRFFAPRVT
ncbi:MAG: rhomboid family intramembrane serine protease [Reyranella sp.]|jgi:membrane associated rhomboid family serine protease|nr:MAG: rhomboid family intramembrane serine protease [Reyranella sp.]